MCKECESEHKHYTCECGKSFERLNQIAGHQSKCKVHKAILESEREAKRLPNGLFKCENPDCNNEHDGSYGSGRFCSAHCRRVWSGKHAASNGNHKCNFPKPKKSKYGTWSCRFCGLIFETKHELYDHYHECHSDKLMPHGKGHIAWNRGLTKDTDERVRKWTKTMHDKYESGELVGSFTGRHHSSETKDKLRIAALNSKHQRVCKKTFTYTKMNGDIVKMDSSYELIVAKILDAHCIEWIRPEPIPWIDSNGVMHNYFADFFIPTKNIYLDPKNEYCFRVQAVKIKCLSEQYNNIVFLHKDELTEDNILKLCE